MYGATSWRFFDKSGDRGNRPPRFCLPVKELFRITAVAVITVTPKIFACSVKMACLLCWICFPMRKHAWTQSLVEIMEVLMSAFKRSGDSPDEARKRAEAAAIALSQYFGGRQFYIPMNNGLQRSLRDQKIFADFNGQNVPELAVRYGVSIQMVYRVIAEQRKLRIGECHSIQR